MRSAAVLCLAFLSMETAHAGPMQIPEPDDGRATDQYWSPAQRVSPGPHSAERRAPIGAPNPSSGEAGWTGPAGNSRPNPARSPAVVQETQTDGAAIPIPNIDIDTACRQSGLDQGVCVRRAQRYYDLVRLEWDSLSPAGQRYCVKGAADALHRFPNGYYEALYGFVALQAGIEQRDRDRVDPPHFQPR